MTIYHIPTGRWLEVLYLTPDDELYYAVVKDPEHGDTFAVARESVALPLDPRSLNADEMPHL